VDPTVRTIWRDLRRSHRIGIEAGGACGSSVSAMLLDAPRTEITRRIRCVADHLAGSLPTTVPGEFPLGFATVAPLLLARIAGQGRTTATLIGRRHELDAQMLMRSMLEHLTLVAWLAIEPEPTTEGQVKVAARSARTPEEKTKWWVADQYRRDERHLQAQHRLIAELEADVRADIKIVKKEMHEELGWGEPPKLEVMTEEVDAAWGGRLPGWARAGPREASFPSTVQGFYVTLYAAGSRSTHPGLGHLMATFLERNPADGARARLVAEPVNDRVSPLVSIVAYLLLYAAAIAEHLYGGTVLDDALRDLDRFDIVRGPELLLKQVNELLDEDGSLRRFGMADGLPVRIEQNGGITTVVFITPSGWERIVHEPGPLWLYDDSRGASFRVGRLEIDETVAAHIARFRDRLATASWDDAQHEWPDAAP